MSAYESNRRVPLGSVATFRVVSAVEGLVDAVLAWRAARRTRAVLNDLSDDQLVDIGLHRAAIPNVARDLARR